MGKNPEKKKARSEKLKFLSTETQEEDGDINVFSLSLKEKWKLNQNTPFTVRTRDLYCLEDLRNPLDYFNIYSFFTNINIYNKPL